MMTTEHPLNTIEQVTDYLRAALGIVDDLDPPEDLRVVCFGKAAELVAAKQIFFEQSSILPQGMVRH
jgi:hypothetical protein